MATYIAVRVSPSAKKTSAGYSHAEDNDTPKIIWSEK